MSEGEQKPVETMSERERRAVEALIAMTIQYLGSREGELVDSLAMSAGEKTITVLAEYGLMEIVLQGRIFGKWNTEAVSRIGPV